MMTKPTLTVSIVVDSMVNDLVAIDLMASSRW